MLERPMIDRFARRIVRSNGVTMHAAAGMLTGYAMEWSNAGPEVIQRGCFARSISQAVPRRKVFVLMEDAGRLECVGAVLFAEEDTRGLVIGAKVHGDLPDGQYAAMVGFRPVRWLLDERAETPTLTHTECELLEIVLARSAAAIYPAPKRGWVNRLCSLVTRVRNGATGLQTANRHGNAIGTEEAS